MKRHKGILNENFFHFKCEISSNNNNNNNERNDKFPTKYFVSAECTLSWMFACVFDAKRTKYDDTFYALTRMYATQKREKKNEKEQMI